jgi:beta-aspartyl-peptidase (threonine type)
MTSQADGARRVVEEEAVAAPAATRLLSVPPAGEYALALHGGAGGRISELAEDERHDFEAALAAAHRAGERILADGGPALDAVCAAVQAMEDDPLFNAGRGAALTTVGEAELDASVMTGDGRAGAVAGSRHARNPVLLARRVMERSPHVFLMAPPPELVRAWGLEVVEPDYFVTDARRRQLERMRELQTGGPRHGTVGAVARDAGGRLASATSTGGIVNQDPGRIGDTPVIGAGSYARDGLAAISCTGEGEAFIQGVVSYDIVARMRYLGAQLAGAIAATIDAELTRRHASGGLVSVAADGTVVVAHNSPSLFAAYRDEDGVVTLT